MMKIVLSLLLIHFTCLVYGDVGWSEFGRYRADINNPWSDRVIKQEDTVKSQEQKIIRREKVTDWSTEERYDILIEFIFNPVDRSHMYT